jgi:hypothetical protein
VSAKPHPDDHGHRHGDGDHDDEQYGEPAHALLCGQPLRGQEDGGAGDHPDHHDHDHLEKMAVK